MKIIKDLNNFYAATLAIGVMTIASIAIVIIDNGSTQNNLGQGNNSDVGSRMFISDIVYLEDLDTKATTSSSTPLLSTTSPSSLPNTDLQQSLNTIESDNLQSKDVTEKENVEETLKENVKETAKDKDSKVTPNTIEIASTNETVDTKVNTKVNTSTSLNTDKKIAQAEQAKVQKTSNVSNSLNASNEKSLKTNNSVQSKHTKQVTTAATTTSSSPTTQTTSANTSVNITSTTSTDAKISSSDRSSSDSDLVKASSETDGDTFNESSTNLSSNDIYDISFNLLVSKAKTLLVYPKRAQKMGLEGKVSLNIFINKHGIVKNYSINKSSGVRILDEAAEDIGKKLIGFDTKIKSVEYTVVIPIVYRLNY